MCPELLHDIMAPARAFPGKSGADRKGVAKEMDPNGEWSTQWLDQLKQWIERKREEAPNHESPLTLYPLQLINCIRLERNDAVYIFDEVGCGKTISAGLMALHYLCSHDKNVLIITENSVKGQFWNDWMEKLPFFDWGFVSEWARRGWYFSNPDNGDRIDIAANNHAQIRDANKSEDRFGMIIIDEAHKFLLNEKSMDLEYALAGKDGGREEYLKRLGRVEPARLRELLKLEGQHPDKVVFLTATPVKDDLGQLKTYYLIAKTLLGPKRDPGGSWVREFGVEQNKKDVLCSQFDPKFPVTRYFKETSEQFKHDPGGQPQRCLAHIWEYQVFKPAGERDPKAWRLAYIEQKNRLVMRVIEDVLSRSEHQESADRFVIFVDKVEKDSGVRQLVDYLREYADKKPITSFFPNGKNDVMGIWSDTQNKLFDLLRRVKAGESEDILPRIVVVNYQVGEVGINLPYYNYVINYHIPAFPSSLEQRYGRIDRLTSRYSEIHIGYLICRNQDSRCPNRDTENFKKALQSYLAGLPLPTRNVILDTTLVEEVLKRQKEALERNRKMQELLSDADKLRVCGQQCTEATRWSNASGLSNVQRWLVSFCRKRNILWQGSPDSEEARRNFAETARRALEKQEGSILEQKDPEAVERLIEQLGNHVMFAQSPSWTDFQFPLFVDAVEDCVTHIREKMAAEREKDGRTDNFLSFCES